MIGTKPKSFGFDRSELESIGRVGFLVAATIGLGDRWTSGPAAAGHLGIHSPL